MILVKLIKEIDKSIRNGGDYLWLIHFLILYTIIVICEQCYSGLGLIKISFDYRFAIIRLNNMSR